MRRIGSLLIVGLLASAAPVMAQEGTRLSLSPSSAEGIVAQDVLVGPFGLRNTSRTAFSVQVEPVLLAQRRDGGLTVGDSASSRRAAENFLNLRSSSFAFPPGASEQFRARVLAVPPRGSLYAGLLFKAAPKTQAEGISNALEIVATLYLHPPRNRRRIRFDTEPIRAEQAGPGRLRFLVGVKNVGNFYTKVSGRLRLRDTTGRKVFGGVLKSVKILPGAVVDLPLETKKLIAAGEYAAGATLQAGDKRFKATGTITLFGPSEVATRAARLEDASPEAFLGEPFELDVPYRNTGNVPFAPGAEVRITPQPDGEEVRVEPNVSESRPGQRGSITSTVELPDAVRTFLVNIRLKIGERVLDERTFSVTRIDKPSFLDRFKDWITENALLLVLGLLVLLAAGALFVARYVRRMRSAPAAGSAGPGPARADETAPPAAAPGERVDLNSATEEDLLRLPDVGPRAAQRIIEHREEYGAFASVEDLTRVEGFDQERLAAIRPHVRV